MRGHRVVACLAAFGLAAIPTAYGFSDCPPPPKRTLVGDSITIMYAPYVGPVGTVVGQPGGDAVFWGWHEDLRRAGPQDVIVIQDWVSPEWLAEWGWAWEPYFANLVAIAHELAPKVVILTGGAGASYQSQVRGIRIPLPPADHPDGIHYTEAGSRLVAALVNTA